MQINILTVVNTPHMYGILNNNKNEKFFYKVFDDSVFIFLTRIFINKITRNRS